MHNNVFVEDADKYYSNPFKKDGLCALRKQSSLLPKYFSKTFYEYYF